MLWSIFFSKNAKGNHKSTFLFSRECLDLYEINIAHKTNKKHTYYIQDGKYINGHFFQFTIELEKCRGKKIIVKF